MTLNGASLASVAPGSIILPDTTRAFAILADCKAEPLITLPLEQNPNTGTTIAGGSGPRNPVRVVPGQSTNIQNTVAIPLIYTTAAGLVTALGILGLETGALQKTYQYLKTLVIPGQDSNTAAQILQNRNNNGMDDRQFGNSVGQESLPNNFERCVQKWMQDYEWCDATYYKEFDIKNACHKWAQEELWRCRLNQPSQPFRY